MSILRNLRYVLRASSFLRFLPVQRVFIIANRSACNQEQKTIHNHYGFDRRRKTPRPARPGTATPPKGEKGIRMNRHAVRRSRMTCLFFRSVVSRVHCHRFGPNPAAVLRLLRARPAWTNAHGAFWELYIFLWFFQSSSERPVSIALATALK